IGKLLLQKMGWKDGDGLGKNNEGMKVPIAIDVKTDRKDPDRIKKLALERAMMQQAIMCDIITGKHPVTYLTETCSKRKWNPPDFALLEESGPDHNKLYKFKITLNGVEYLSPNSSQQKKIAKMEAATLCLQKLGLIP
ncbi:hypothetical protein HELRODRAFT_77997, partial [Helobdella robusta]|uniref:G-patch domain-containing protein n=1 Tax=Helobdella robusta TaxID=6412 RepID=T1G364_HELRO